MRLSRKQALALMGRLKSKRASVMPDDGLDSDLERRFLQLLQILQRRSLIPWIGVQNLRLELGRGAWYKPDFHISADSPNLPGVEEELPPTVLLVAYETKGFWREAARVRIKVAARAFPYIRFVAVTEKGHGQFEYETFRS